MRKYLLFLATLTSPVRVVSHGWSIIDINRNQSEVVKRDVCIVGGGASGAHAAVSLMDLNKTVIVIEREAQLGGATQTYIDPKTGKTADIGVVVYQPLTVVEEFFAKFQIPLINTSTVDVNAAGAPPRSSLPAPLYNTFREYADFRNGSSVTPTEYPDAAEALQRMAAAMSQYPYILDGYDLPDPVPEDLYLSYGAWIDKERPAIYVMRYFNLGDIQALTQGYLTSARGNNSELYSRAAEFLGLSNILYESTVISSQRQNTTSGRPELLVSSPDEVGLRLLSCGQILLTIPPTLYNLAGWDLTPDEHAVSAQYHTATGYWTGLVRGIGMNQTISIDNSAATTPYNIPVLPALYQVAPVGTLDDFWWIKLGADIPTLTDGQVRAYATREIQRVQKAQGSAVTEPEWVVLKSHSPFHLQVPPEVIRNGFFANLTALQGGLNGIMSYSGAAFHTHYSSLLWRYNKDVVIPKMLY
ncbi:hypothetical protein M406DRAFT_71032 [Cryphonectria parasitica EP155]|uniref:Amine oxidase domain-containing protein n=1 Tax=Cryphonectria parasitica (strain ATCC 38755 / EP155) TaxID=660469 RepID=A0A9P4Y0R3_CRYP1|nr:uncharacterized protein M406DRAFT_71032 [Cryphonectria parasitica EP155]KAF3764426.1 hypothetical protein M406DRAFT_71032 [Cryphonectria parasitica EP155]